VLHNLYMCALGYSLTDAIRVGCDENGWNIRVDLTVLRNIHPGAVASDIYLGENTCTGTQGWNTVTFQQGLRECLTSQTVSVLIDCKLSSLLKRS
jgi:hypothetical protein